MNKVININLGGRLIPINETAYESLQKYLSVLKQFFSREKGGEEIMQDMEDRIGELLQEKIKRGTASISEIEIEEVKNIMGSPEQITAEAGGNEDAAQDEEKDAKGTPAGEKGEAVKKLSRSKNEKTIGGVCGGLAAYFNIDVTIVRLLFVLVTLFWGTGLLIYLILWLILPAETTPTFTLKKRLYRNMDKKVIGGVCSGIAGYLNIDTVWIRLIFILPFLIGLSSGWLHEVFFLSIGSFPAMILLYIILWIALPKAQSITEKLETEGKKVDINSISEAAKNKPEASKSNKSSGLSFLSFVLKVALGFAGGLILLVLLIIATALISLLIGFTGSSTFLAEPFSQVLLASPTEKILLLISLLFIVFVPLFLLIFLIGRLFSGRKYRLARWWSITMVIIFIAGVFGLFAVAGSVLKDFKSHYETSVQLDLAPINKDTLIIAELPSGHRYGHPSDFINDGLDVEGDLRVRFEKSVDSSFHAVLQKSARGENTTQAQANADKIVFNFQQNGNQLQIPKALDLLHTLPFRNQKATLILSVPAGKWIYFKEVNDDWWEDNYAIRHTNGLSIDITSSRDYSDFSFYKMMPDGHLELQGRSQEKDDDNEYY